MRKQVNLVLFAMLASFLGVACGEETSSVPKTSEEREKLMREALQGTDLTRIKEQFIKNKEAKRMYLASDSSSAATYNNKDLVSAARGETDDYIEKRIKEIAAPNKQRKSGSRPQATQDLDQLLKGISSSAINSKLVEHENSLNKELDYFLILANNGL